MMVDPAESLFLAQQGFDGVELGTYFLFIVAGLLVGGTWSAYKAGARIATIILGLLSVVALAGAVLWLIGAMG